MANIFGIGDIGFNVELDITDEDGNVFDISTATVKQIVFVKPDQSTITVDASFVTNGSDGKIYYNVSTSILDYVGRWLIYAVVTGPTFNRTSTRSWFQVA